MKSLYIEMSGMLTWMNSFPSDLSKIKQKKISLINFMRQIQKRRVSSPMHTHHVQFSECFTIWPRRNHLVHIKYKPIMLPRASPHSKTFIHKNMMEEGETDNGGITNAVSGVFSYSAAS